MKRCYMPVVHQSNTSISVCSTKQCDKLQAPGTRHNFCRLHLKEFYEWLFASNIIPWRTAS